MKIVSLTTSTAANVVMLLATTTLLLLSLGGPTHSFALPAGVECDPRSIRKSCMSGCFSCWDTFGGELYDMASCCRKCRITNAVLIDDGPTECSKEHIRSSWLKRFG